MALHWPIRLINPPHSRHHALGAFHFDREKLLARLSESSVQLDMPHSMSVFKLNISGEDSKSGVTLSEANCAIALTSVRTLPNCV